jgi:hypothetical protein
LHSSQKKIQNSAGSELSDRLGLQRSEMFSGFALAPLVGGKLHKPEKMQIHSEQQILRVRGMERK